MAGKSSGGQAGTFFDKFLVDKNNFMEYQHSYISYFYELS